MAISHSDSDELLPIGKTAEMLDVSFSTLRRWDRTGHLTSVRLHPGGPRRYRRSDVEAMITAEASA